jgi:hypothetical protein
MENDTSHGILYPYKIKRKEVDGAIYYCIYKFDGKTYRDIGNIKESLQETIIRITRLKEVEDEMNKGEWVSDEDIKISLI